MPEKRTRDRARKAKREGKSPSRQAGEFVKEEIHHIREGKHGARSASQAIAIGLAKARRAGVNLKPPAKGTVSEETRKSTERDYDRGQSPARNRPSVKRSRRARKNSRVRARPPLPRWRCPGMPGRSPGGADRADELSAVADTPGRHAARPPPSAASSGPLGRRRHRRDREHYQARSPPSPPSRSRSPSKPGAAARKMLSTPPAGVVFRKRTSRASRRRPTVLKHDERAGAAPKRAGRFTMLTTANPSVTACLNLARAIGGTRTVEEIYGTALDALEQALGVASVGDPPLRRRRGDALYGARGLSERYRRAVEGHTPWQPVRAIPSPSSSATSRGPVPRAVPRGDPREGIGGMAFVPLVSRRLSSAARCTAPTAAPRRSRPVRRAGGGSGRRRRGADAHRRPGPAQ